MITFHFSTDQEIQVENERTAVQTHVTAISRLEGELDTVRVDLESTATKLSGERTAVHTHVTSISRLEGELGTVKVDEITTVCSNRVVL